MKHALKLILFSVLLINGCGVANNLGVAGKNLGRLFSTHPYAVDESRKAEILASGKAIVGMDFIDTGTAWRRVAPDGTIEPKNYTLTYHEIGGAGRRMSQLPPGTYFLNGAISGTAQVQSGYYARSIDMQSFGWNESKREARCFSFTVNPGEILEIPDILVERNPLMDKNETICPLLSFKGPVPFNAPYAIGPESKKQPEQR